LKGLVCALAALVLTAPAAGATTIDAAARYLEARQQPDGGFAEPRGVSDPGLTAWVVLGLVAAGRPPAGAAEFLEGKPYPTATDLELRILALVALGHDVQGLADRLEGLRRPSGAIGPSVSSTIWGVLALRAAGRPLGEAVSYLLARQSHEGGFAWHEDAEPDSNDTAAAVQALRAGGIPAGSKAIGRALAHLRSFQNADGGFELEPGRGSDVQSTAWAIQALLAAGRPPGDAAYAYLRRMQRRNGSFRYSARYAVTPVWVTAQALAALAGRPFPLG
jgi:prenyltransferase beta subunit